MLNNIKKLQVIKLTDDDFEEAKKISDRFDESIQWQIYLNVLGLEAIKTYLNERLLDPKIKVNCEKYDLLLNTVYNFKVGGFKLCLLICDNFLDEVNIPKVVIDSPAHFYIIMEVIEELERAILRCFIRYDKLTEQHKKWQIENQDSYSLPVSCFDFELTHLLVYLHHLDPKTIPLPIPSVTIVPDLITDNLKQVVDSVADTYREIERKIRAIAEELSWQFTILDSMALARGKETEIDSYLWEQKLAIAGQNYVLQVTVREKSGEFIHRFLLKNAVVGGSIPGGFKLKLLTENGELIGEDKASQARPEIYLDVVLDPGEMVRWETEPRSDNYSIDISRFQEVVSSNSL